MFAGGHINIPAVNKRALFCTVCVKLWSVDSWNVDTKVELVKNHIVCLSWINVSAKFYELDNDIHTGFPPLLNPPDEVRPTFVVNGSMRRSNEQGIVER